MTPYQQAGVFLLIVISVLVRMFTGYTPLRWTALLLLYAEAGIEQSIITFGFAVEHYVTHYKACLVAIRASIAIQMGEDV